MQSYRPVPIKLHVALDYLYVALGLAGPWLFGFSHHFGATAYTIALAIFGLALNVITDNPGGVWKVLPFKWHQYVEWAAPPPFIVVPWLFFPQAGAMPWLLTGIGVTILVSSALTRPVPASSSNMQGRSAHSGAAY